MNKLIELAHYINRYNLKGSIRLAPIKLAILYKKIHQPIVNSIVNDMKCEKTNTSFQLMGLSGYSIMRSTNICGLELHLLSSLMEEEVITDDMFLRRKKIIQKLRCNKSTIFLCLEESQFSLAARSTDKSQILELKRIDTSVCKNIKWGGSLLDLYRQLIRSWESIHRFDIISVLANLKQMIKNLEKNRKRQQEWITVKQGRVEQLSFAFQLLKMSNDYLICSLQGYYSAEASHFQNQFSIHWQIMDVFEDLWKQQSEKINRELDRMPLSYIGQVLAMSNCHTLGGFLPESCFLQVFKPILQDLAEHIICCLEGAKYKVLQSIQSIYEYYFMKTSIKDQLVQFQLKNVEMICQTFLKEVENAIYSQINYVYTPSQSFWQMRSIKSNLYSEQQQANIQIKYIGKVYIKKVYESIRESIPRYIGQGLLRKVSKYFRDNGLNNLLDVIKDTDFTINLSNAQMEQIKNKQANLIQYGQLFHYFSLKVSSTFKIKNLLEKNQLRWKQMYQNHHQNQITEPRADPQKGGLMGWIKRIFKSEKKVPKRSRSCQKQQLKEQQSNNNQAKNVTQLKKQKQGELAITEKVWILILNTNRKIEQQRLIMAASQGFPSRLRPAIWYWLATRHIQAKELKLSQIFEKNTIEEQTARQIEKDLSRTPPPQLFKVKLRGCLKRVLSGYSTIDNQIKYTQGMNFIVAIALATLTHWGIKDDYLVDSSQKPNMSEIEEKSFAILKYIMHKQGLRRVMFIERQYIAEICFRIDEQIKINNERVWNIIQESGFTCEIIFGPILISGLSTWSKKMEVCRRIMDLFICRGFSILYKVVAGIAAMSEQQLSRLKNQQIYDYLRNKSLDEFYERGGQKGLTNLFLSI